MYVKSIVRLANKKWVEVWTYKIGENDILVTSKVG